MTPFFGISASARRSLATGVYPTRFAAVSQDKISQGRGSASLWEAWDGPAQGFAMWVSVCFSAPCCCCRRAQVFSKDETGMLRTWGPRANIQAVNQQARLAAAQLLGQLAVLRLHQVSACLACSAVCVTSPCLPFTADPWRAWSIAHNRRTP